MGQLTLARFRGDTAFALVARLISTLGGGILGLLIWQIVSRRLMGLGTDFLKGTFHKDLPMVLPPSAVYAFPSSSMRGFIGLFRL